MNECLNGALQWTSIPSGVNSPQMNFVASAAEIASGSTVALTKIKRLLDMNEGMEIFKTSTEKLLAK